jgi:hypothetical protein
MEAEQSLRRALDLTPHGKDYSVIASLPKNSTSLAVKAEESGADAILLNIDGEENSSPGHFGSYDLHDVYINDVISTVSVPCGIGIGGARPLTEEYWERIMSSAFAFVDMYAHQMPIFALADSRVKKIAAVSAGYVIEQVKQISQLEEVEAVECATVPAQHRGNPFSLFDYATLGMIAGLSAKPVLLRTQKAMTRIGVSKVMKLGVKGLVVESGVYAGSDEAYSHELANLSPRGTAPEQEE